MSLVEPPISAPDQLTVQSDIFRITQPSPTGLSRYEYHELSPSVPSIRLIELLPGGKYDVIRCTISHTSVATQRPYNAVSYCWGEKKAAGFILLNDTVFEVRESLWWLLYHLRLPDTSRLLWIDGICIDQSNIQERNSQVQLMNQIYSEASAVLVFLGLGDERSDAAMDHLRKEYESRSISLEDQDGVLSLEDTKAMEVLCSREYWTRTWILQEVLVAQRLELYCGVNSIPWPAFEYMAGKFRRELYIKERWLPLKKRIVAISRGPAIRLVNHKAKRLQSSQDSTLLSLLERYRLSQCTDQRDSVYALLGLASDRPMQNGLLPDYAKDVVTLYTEVLQFCKVDPSKTLWFAFLLRMMLKIRLRDIIAYDRLPTSSDPSFVEVKAACLGRISYIFPSLDILRPGHRPFEAYLDDSDCESDSDREHDEYVHEAVGYVKYARYIDSHRGYVSIIPADEQVQERADREVLMNSISYTPDNFTHSTTKRHADFDHIEYPWPMAIKKTGSDLQNREHDRAQKAFTKLFSHHEKAQRKPQPNLIEANGRGFQRRAGYACDHAKPGDMVCQFIGLDVSLVLRHEHPSYKIVGRIDMMEQNLPDRWEDIASESKRFRPSMLTPEAFHAASHVTLRVTALHLLRFARHDFTSFTVPDLNDCKSSSNHSWPRWPMDTGTVFTNLQGCLSM